MAFAQSAVALWSANFRDLNGSITRMATLADGGRITVAVVEEEIQRLRQRWQGTPANLTNDLNIAETLLTPARWQTLDRYDQQLITMLIQACTQCQSIAEAGRHRFNISRNQKTSSNDSHRLRQILQKYDLSFEKIKNSGQTTTPNGR